MQLVSPGVQMAAWQVLAWQYCPVGQSVELMQRTHEPLVRSHSRPSGVQVWSEAHFVRQVSATQVLVVSAQSASVTQATQRPTVVSQTSVLEQSSEFVHGRERHAGARGAVVVRRTVGGGDASTHWAIDGSHTMPTWHCRLFWQPCGVPPSGFALPLPPPQSSAATTAPATNKRENRERRPRIWPEAKPS